MVKTLPREGSIRPDQFVATLAKVVPFTAEAATPGRPETDLLEHVWLEVDGGLMGFTTADGYRMAHATIEGDWPNGSWLLDGATCKALVDHTLVAGLEDQVPIVVGEGLLLVGTVEIPVMGATWLEYQQRFYEPAQDGQAMVIVARKDLKRALQEVPATTVGFSVRDGRCRLYLARENKRDHILETLSCVPVKAQMAIGEVRVAFDLEKLKKAVSFCGDTVTLKLREGEKAGFIEGASYWHLLMPLKVFPNEVELTRTHRESLEWVQEMLKAILKGEVQAQVRLGKGSVVVIWDPAQEQTTVTLSQRETLA